MKNRVPLSLPQVKALEFLSTVPQSPRVWDGVKMRTYRILERRGYVRIDWKDRNTFHAKITRIDHD